jgi:ribosomal protein S18 acetylase RimI-like enzyme
MPGLLLRRARDEDAEAVVAILLEGLETYRDFAPNGWDPPKVRVHVVRSGLRDAARWCLVAETGGGIGGYVAFLAARDHRVPDPDPQLAHLGQLFVRPPHWGTGLAPRLLVAAVAEAEERGYLEMRLFAPLDSARAIRFYEREGFVRAGEPFPSDELANGLPVVEYRRQLAA